jgi:hypothetical protein
VPQPKALKTEEIKGLNNDACCNFFDELTHKKAIETGLLSMPENSEKSILYLKLNTSEKNFKLLKKISL